jgi:hypothetical protein
VLEALAYAKSISPNHLAAVTVVSDEVEQERIEQQWEEFGIDVPLEIVYSPYRELTRPILRFVDEIEREFKRRREFMLALAPEGTRRAAPFWKSGFYRIAREAKVPVALAFIDFPAREIGVGAYVELTGDIAATHGPGAAYLPGPLWPGVVRVAKGL